MKACDYSSFFLYHDMAKISQMSLIMSVGVVALRD